jgi:EAL domain-containing protein (putative c-di-GMP-specific phosphodiesterase class I)
LRETDTLARLGGDQFAVLLEACSSCCEAQRVAEHVQRLLASPFRLGEHELFISASIGIACYPAHAADAHTLLETAEHVTSRVKEEGGGAHRFAEAERRNISVTQYGVEAALRNALRREELQVHYQPKIDFRTGKITGAEALLRWTHPELGIVSPAGFIPIAEETGLIVPIGTWVLETACRQAVAWRRAGRLATVSVNLSPRQFRQEDLTATVERALTATGLPGHCLELEITESTTMANPARAAQVMAELHALGVILSLDDFGTGYSSLSYLRQFPLDCLKIDKSFVRDICTSPGDEAIVAATIALAHGLRLRVVAEGVETLTQHEQLSRLGCDFGQGFLYGVPMPVKEFDETAAKHGNSIRLA